MNREQTQAHKEMCERIEQMDGHTLADLVRQGKCPYDPSNLIDVPIGMFHCPVCGEMIVAGLKHGEDSRSPEDREMFAQRIEAESADRPPVEQPYATGDAAD